MDYKYYSIPSTILTTTYQDDAHGSFDTVLIDSADGYDDLVWLGYRESAVGYTEFLVVNPAGVTTISYTDSDTRRWDVLGMAEIVKDNGLKNYTVISQDYTTHNVVCKTRDATFSSASEVINVPNLAVTEDWTKIVLIKDDRSCGVAETFNSLRVWVEYYNGAVSPNTDQGFEYSVKSFETAEDGLYPSDQVVRILPNHTIMSKPFEHKGSVYLILGHNQTTQATNYIVGGRGYFGRIDYGSAAGHRHFVTDLTPNDGRFLFSMTHQNRLLTDGVISRSVVGVTIDFDEIPFQSAEAGSSLFISGAIPATYSSKQEQYGFNWFPEDAWSGTPYSTGGVLSDGTYYYKVIYEYVDDYGNVHRSYPSGQIEVVLSAGTATQGADIYAPTLTILENERTVKAVFYRTEEGGGNYHRVADIDIEWPNTDNYEQLAFDTVADADLLDNELLYTTGNILGNITPPASSIIVMKNNRAFVNNMANPNVLYYSKPGVSGLALEFPEEFQLRVDEGGAITGIGTMDDKIVVFKKDKIFYFQGEGPNALGVGQFSPTYPIATDVGCVDRNSVISFSGGLLFKSEKGIYLLNRGLSLSYVGSPVEDYNDYTILKSVLVDDKNQIRFTLEAGQPTLVFDYLHSIWTTFTNHNAIDACMLGNTYYWLGHDGVVHKEDQTFTDGDFVIPAIIETPWFKSGSLQSFLRVFRMELIGKYRSKHTLKVAVFTDYNSDSPIHTFEFDAAINYVPGEPLQFVGHLGRKCESIKFKVYDDDMQEPYESFELTAIGLEIGMKKGLYKQPKTKKI